jgi:hypothetical protein
MDEVVMDEVVYARKLFLPENGSERGMAGGWDECREIGDERGPEKI